MNDELHQLLHQADASAQAPALDASNLPDRIRRSARNQRRLAACGLAILALLVLAPLLFLHQSPAPSPDNAPALVTAEWENDLHERTIAIFEARKASRQVIPKDSFLTELQMQRNRAALVLLNDANRKLQASDPLAVDALRRTVELFPDTPAAAQAGELLNQHSSQRPS
jgi:hypothetical protein